MGVLNTLRLLRGAIKAMPSHIYKGQEISLDFEPLFDSLCWRALWLRTYGSDHWGKLQRNVNKHHFLFVDGFYLPAARTTLVWVYRQQESFCRFPLLPLGKERKLWWNEHLANSLNAKLKLQNAIDRLRNKLWTVSALPRKLSQMETCIKIINIFLSIKKSRYRNSFISFKKSLSKPKIISIMKTSQSHFHSRPNQFPQPQLLANFWKRFCSRLKTPSLWSNFLPGVSWRISIRFISPI